MWNWYNKLYFECVTLSLKKSLRVFYCDISGDEKMDFFESTGDSKIELVLRNLIVVESPLDGYILIYIKIFEPHHIEIFSCGVDESRF